MHMHTWRWMPMGLGLERFFLGYLITYYLGIRCCGMVSVADLRMKENE
jgi:hypothetical protein